MVDKPNMIRHPAARPLRNRLRNFGVLGHSWELSLSKIHGLRAERVQAVATHSSHNRPNVFRFHA